MTVYSLCEWDQMNSVQVYQLEMPGLIDYFSFCQKKKMGVIVINFRRLQEALLLLCFPCI